MQSELLPLQGLGKLSKPYLLRLIRRTVTGTDGTVYRGASKYELLSVLYLSQIADKSGYIKQFRLCDFSKTLGCSEREVYVIIHNLVDKNYISAQFFENKKWTGFRNIKLLGNDFSKVKYNKDIKYLNTFHTFFDWSEEHKKLLDGLSLYALRLFVFLLFAYDIKNGYNTSSAYLCEILQLKDRKLVLQYFEELKPLLGKNFYETKPSKKRKEGYIHIFSKNEFMISESKPADKQLTYYKRKWLLFIENNKGEVFNIPSLVARDSSYEITIHDVLNRIFSMVYSYLIKGQVLGEIERVVEDALRDMHYKVDCIGLARIDASLQAKFDYGMA